MTEDFLAYDVGHKYSKMYPFGEREIAEIFKEWASILPHPYEEAYSAAMDEEDSWVDVLEKILAEYSAEDA